MNLVREEWQLFIDFLLEMYAAGHETDSQPGCYWHMFKEKPEHTLTILRLAFLYTNVAFKELSKWDGSALDITLNHYFKLGIHDI